MRQSQVVVSQHLAHGVLRQPCNLQTLLQEVHARVVIPATLKVLGQLGVAGKHLLRVPCSHTHARTGWGGAEESHRVELSSSRRGCL